MQISADTLRTAIETVTLAGGVFFACFRLVGRLARVERKQREAEETQRVLLASMFAVLDGLRQLGCNGEVSQAHKKLRERVIND